MAGLRDPSASSLGIPLVDTFAVVDVTVSLRSFVNLSLRSQGWYALRVRVRPDPRIKAVWPYKSGFDGDEAEASAAGSTTGTPQRSLQYDPTQRGHVESGWAWCSKTFRIRFCYEEIMLDEAPSFQVFVRRPDRLKQFDLLLDLELLWQECDNIDAPVLPHTWKLKAVACDTVRVRGAACPGCAAYHPATWDADYFGLGNVTILSSLSGFVTRSELRSLGRLLGRDLRRPKGPLVLLHSGVHSTHPAPAPGLKVAATIKQPPAGFVAKLCSGPEAVDVIRPGTAPRGPAPPPVPPAPQGGAVSRTRSQEVDAASQQGGSMQPPNSGALRLSLMGVSGTGVDLGAATDRSMVSTPTLGLNTTPKRLLGPSSPGSCVSTEPDSVWLDVDASGASGAATPNGMLTTRTSDAPPAVGLAGAGESAGAHGVPASARPGDQQAGQHRTPTRVVHCPGTSTVGREGAQDDGSNTGNGPGAVLVAAAPAGSLLLQLQELVARGGAKGAEVVSLSERPAPDVAIQRIQALYTTLVEPARAASAKLRRYLRGLPTSVYHPQTYEVLSKIMEGVPSASQLAVAAALQQRLQVEQRKRQQRQPQSAQPASGAPAQPEHQSRTSPGAGPGPGPGAQPLGAGRLGRLVVEVARSAGVSAQHQPPLNSPSAATAGGGMQARGSISAPTTPAGLLGPNGEVLSLTGMLGGASDVVLSDVSTWADIPDTGTFISWMPPNSSTAMAVQYLDAVVTRVRGMLTTDWSVLQWVVRYSAGELHKFSKCLYELEQDDLIQHLVVVDPLAQDASALSAAAAAQRSRLWQMHVEPPLVHRPAFWDSLFDQPMLVVDDSVGRYAGWRHTGAEDTTQQLLMAAGPRSPMAQAAAAARGAAGSDALKPGTASRWQAPAGWGEAGGGREPQTIHAVIFVHGYQGAPSDLNVLKGHLQLVYPHLECYCSKANEGHTHGSLEAMGSRLASEISTWLAPFTAPGARRPLSHLSFVGHSMGNLIIRFALRSPLLKELIPRLELLLSVAGPHLGQLYTGNTLLELGVGFLKAVTRGKCLSQLALTDAGSLHRTALYSLATDNPDSAPSALQRFRNVVLVASQQDRYVPHHSARLSPCEAARRDGVRGQAAAEMLECSLRGFGCGPTSPQLLRVDVNFAVRSLGQPPNGSRTGGSTCDGSAPPAAAAAMPTPRPSPPAPAASMSTAFSDLLGRTAHIALLESDAFAQALVWGVIKRYHLIQPEGEHTWVW